MAHECNHDVLARGNWACESCWKLANQVADKDAALASEQARVAELEAESKMYQSMYYERHHACAPHRTEVRLAEATIERLRGALDFALKHAGHGEKLRSVSDMGGHCDIQITGDEDDCNCWRSKVLTDTGPREGE